MTTTELIALAAQAGLKARVKDGKVTLTGPGLAAPMSFPAAGGPAESTVFAVRNIKAMKDARKRA